MTSERHAELELPATRDVVDTLEEARRLPEPPLVVRRELERALGLDHLLLERAPSGHSNVTFFLESGTTRLVLRRPPRPPFPATAHDVLREYRMLEGLARAGVRVPRVLSAHPDPSVIGAPFYVMERVEGVIAEAATPPPLDCPEERARMAQELVDSLVELHAVDWRRAEIGGRPGGYLARQLQLWKRQWKHNRTREVEAIEELGERLSAAVPETAQATVVHGDYKLDNVVFAARRPTHLIAILDWEMATIGDPLADVGFLTATWLQADDPPDRLLGLSGASAEHGFLSRSELADRYARASGRALDELPWYQALALWKLAILLEASYKRYRAGTTDDDFFARLDTGVPALAAQALGALRGELG